MPTSKSPRGPEPTPQPEKTPGPAETPPIAPVAPVAPVEPTVEPEAVETAEDAAPVGPPPGVYEYTHFIDCTYPHVPLSCRAATASTNATVYDWPFGPPADGRWAPTTKTPNQVADNAAPLASEE